MLLLGLLSWSLWLVRLDVDHEWHVPLGMASHMSEHEVVDALEAVCERHNLKLAIPFSVHVLLRPEPFPSETNVATQSGKVQSGLEPFFFVQNM